MTSILPDRERGERERGRERGEGEGMKTCDEYLTGQRKRREGRRERERERERERGCKHVTSILPDRERGEREGGGERGRGGGRGDEDM